MRLACSNIVGALNSWWGYIGWGLFISLLLTPYVLSGSPAFGLCYLALALMFISWWFIDFMDQSAPVWAIILGVICLVLGLLGVALLLIGYWVLYWFRVRE